MHYDVTSCIVITLVIYQKYIYDIRYFTESQMYAGLKDIKPLSYRYVKTKFAICNWTSLI